MINIRCQGLFLYLKVKIMIIYGKMPSIWWLIGLPLLMVSQFLLVSGISLAIASANLFFRDLERLVSIGTNLLFYLTPIIYSQNMIPREYQYYMMLNPVAPIIIAYRNLFFYGVLDLKHILFSMMFSTVIFLLGYALFNKLKWKLAEVL